MIRKRRGLGYWTDYSKYIPEGYYIPEGAGRVEWPTCPVTNKPAMVHTMPWGDNVAICPKPAAPEVVYLAPPSSGGGPYPLKVTFKYPYQEWPPISLIAPTLPGFVPEGAYQAGYPIGITAPPFASGMFPSGGGIESITGIFSKIPMWGWIAIGIAALMYFKNR